MLPKPEIKRCHRCPPRSFCDSCATINNDREHVGLIRHPNDEMPRVSAYITPTPSGRYRGCASMDGELIYKGKPQSREQALAFAHSSAECIREGLRYDGWDC